MKKRNSDVQRESCTDSNICKAGMLQGQAVHRGSQVSFIRSSRIIFASTITVYMTPRLHHTDLYIPLDHIAPYEPHTPSSALASTATMKKKIAVVTGKDARRVKAPCQRRTWATRLGISTVGHPSSSRNIWKTTSTGKTLKQAAPRHLWTEDDKVRPAGFASILALLLVGVFTANADTSTVLSTCGTIPSAFHSLGSASWLLTAYFSRHVRFAAAVRQAQQPGRSQDDAVGGVRVVCRRVLVVWSGRARGPGVVANALADMVLY